MRLRTLSEAECYVRCYGDRDDSVSVVRRLRRRPWREIVRGETVRSRFEERLDARGPEQEAA
jgi:hypothetical protein